MMNKSVKRVIKRLLGIESNAVAAPKWKRRHVWSIGIYGGKSPFELGPTHHSNPVLTRDSVSDVRASFVADPFMLKVDGTWHMFFEVMNRQANKGEIGLAISQDAFQWSYQQIVLREPFHLSYPYVFEWENEYYMIPESYRAKSVRLYKAVDFPAQWSFVSTLLEGDDFVDPSIFYFNQSWWLFTDLHRPPFYAGTLRLFHADNLAGPWVEHPKSPVLDGNPHISRPAGRVLVSDEKIIRYSQDCSPVYGTQVRAFEITELTPTNYQERPIGLIPIIQASGSGWNESGMHHIDPHRLSSGQWIACVDGFRWEELRSKDTQ
ncbi:MAG: hypothetical protein WD688_12690 [Candidatus Binatia bacterium]